MVGYAEMTEVMLWGQTTVLASVRIRYCCHADSTAEAVKALDRTSAKEY